MSAPTQLELEHQLSRAKALRRVLGDGSWWTCVQLARAVGHRFGGAVEVLRKGLDNEPAWFIEKERLTANGKLWRYRWVGVNPNPPKRGESWKGRALRAERKLRELGVSP